MGEASFLPGIVVEGRSVDGPKKIRLQATGDVVDIPGSAFITQGDNIEVMIRPTALTRRAKPKTANRRRPTSWRSGSWTRSSWAVVSALSG